jgi:thiamine-phosphate pyrophosphorylase
MNPHRRQRDPSPRGLYLVTPDEADDGRLLARTAPVLPFATWLQYRNKAAGPAVRARQAAALQGRCATAGVHLGEDDGDIAAARALLGTDAIIGVSCYDDAGRAHAAAAAGADYLAFGAFFPSSTKPGARHARPDLLRQTASLDLPRVAIGGITPDNAPALIAAGADLVAVISGVFDAPDPIAAARAYRALFA